VADSTPDDVALAAEAALGSQRALEDLGRAGRAALLRRAARELEERREEVVRTADLETALGTDRLHGELTRTTYQLEAFAEVLDDGAYLEAVVDHAGATPMGPRPDLRRMLVPLGPVAVFAASNFPLAFSVPGGDTASALAAGCAVVVKAHPGHPATSELCAEALSAAVAGCGAPAASVQVVHGFDAGRALAAAPGVRAVAFTGSAAGGRALLDITSSRPDPIPFFGELGSINPVVVTEAAARDRAAQIGTGLAGSFLLGGGQFCTKPGVVLAPTGPAGDAVLAALEEAARATGPIHMLTASMAESFSARPTSAPRGQGSVPRRATSSWTAAATRSGRRCWRWTPPTSTTRCARSTSARASWSRATRRPTRLPRPSPPWAAASPPPSTRHPRTPSCRA